MHVASLDPGQASDEVLDRVHEVAARCHAEANRLQPYRSPSETRQYLRHPPASEPRWYWTALLDGEIAGFGQLGLPPSSTVGELTVLVRPEMRGRGCGRALLDAAMGRARSRCEALIATHATPAGAAFARRVGAVDTRRDVSSVLRLAEAELDAPEVDGYRLRGWEGRAPEGLVESFARAREAINDAPRAAPGEWQAWDVGRVRDMEQAAERRGRQILVTVALDPAGAVVALTELRVSAEAGAIATTEDTVVVAAHRGRGLARWIKAESLCELRRQRPDVELVTTTNAEENLPMRAVNTRIGFVPSAVYTACSLAVE
ncbi:MAG: GNAT family N-acetyltransferase [Gaiellales bacterium]